MRGVDWKGEDSSNWYSLLDLKPFPTVITVDATGAKLSTTNLTDQTQRMEYDVAGLLKASWLVLRGKQEHVIVKSLSYSAAGQKLREEHGNGVVTSYSYEPQTQRLTGIKTERPSGHRAGAKILQDLRYDYDPAGNVVQETNRAEATRFWRNQKVTPVNTYI